MNESYEFMNILSIDEAKKLAINNKVVIVTGVTGQDGSFMIDKLIKQFPRATFIVLLVFVVLVIIKVLSGGSVEWNEGLALQFFYTMLYGYTLYYANAIIFIKLDDVYQTNRFSRNRIFFVLS